MPLSDPMLAMSLVENENCWLWNSPDSFCEVDEAVTNETIPSEPAIALVLKIFDFWEEEKHVTVVIANGGAWNVKFKSLETLTSGTRRPVERGGVNRRRTAASRKVDDILEKRNSEKEKNSMQEGCQHPWKEKRWKKWKHEKQAGRLSLTSYKREKSLWWKVNQLCEIIFLLFQVTCCYWYLRFYLCWEVERQINLAKETITYTTKAYLSLYSLLKMTQHQRTFESLYLCVKRRTENSFTLFSLPLLPLSLRHCTFTC